MNLDEELRRTLTARAEDAPSGVGLSENIRTRVRRHQVRRRLGAVAAVAAIGVGVASSAPYAIGLVRPGPAPDLAASGRPSATATATPNVATHHTPDRPSRVALVSTPVPLVTFDLTPQWTPPGLPGPTVGHNQDFNYLTYESADDSAPGLVVELTRTLQSVGWTARTTHATTVHGRPGTLTTGVDAGTPVSRLTWQLADRRWVDVQGFRLSTTVLQRYADNLSVHPFTAPMPLTLSLAPAGYRVSFQEFHPLELHYCLAPAGNHDETAGMCVTHNPENTAPAGSERVQVGPDPGELGISDGVVTLVVHRPGFEFMVTEGTQGPLSNADLIRLAAGVTSHR